MSCTFRLFPDVMVRPAGPCFSESPTGWKDWDEVCYSKYLKAEFKSSSYLGHHNHRLAWNSFEELAQNLLANTIAVEVRRIERVKT